MCIGIYTNRHPGRDCRDPVAMDGNVKLHTSNSSDMKLTWPNFSHPCVLDSGNPCRNDATFTCV